MRAGATGVGGRDASRRHARIVHGGDVKAVGDGFRAVVGVDEITVVELGLSDRIARRYGHSAERERAVVGEAVDAEAKILIFRKAGFFVRSRIVGVG